MFVHTSEGLPADPHFPEDLASLGYKLNQNGQIVSIDFPNRFFTFHHTSNERMNDVRKEAVHRRTRKLVIDELESKGVVEIYLSGEKGNVVLGVGRKEKPKEKSIPILGTMPSELKKKQDVIIVIGEHNQDCGIWAWRHLCGEGGINGGSAVGLVKKLAVLGMDSTEVKHKDFLKEKREREREKKDPTTAPLEDAGIICRDFAIQDPSKVPGVIILNPGALLYSHQENECMTAVSWRNRQHDWAEGHDHVISEEHNYIPGHTTHKEHIETCMDSIVEQLVNKDANLYIVGITTGAEDFLNWYQDRQCIVGTEHHNHAQIPGIHSQVNALALMESTHNPTGLRCRAAEHMLNVRAKQWIKSSKPLGTFMNAAQSTDPDLVVRDDAVEESAEPVIPRAGNEMSTNTGEAEKAVLPETFADGTHVSLYTPITPSTSTENLRGDTPPEIYARDAEDGSPSGSSTISAGLSGMSTPVEDPDSSTNSLPVLETPLDDLALSSSASDAGDPAAGSGLSLSAELAEVGEDEEDYMASSYDHVKEIVNCATYSGGTDVDELIWTNCMDLALDHFKFVAEQTARPGFFAADD